MIILVICYNAPPTFSRHVFYRIPKPTSKYQALFCSLDFRYDLNYHVLVGLVRETKMEQEDFLNHRRISINRQIIICLHRDKMHDLKQTLYLHDRCTLYILL